LDATPRTLEIEPRFVDSTWRSAGGGEWIEKSYGVSYTRSALVKLLAQLELEYRKPQVLPRKLDPATQQPRDRQHRRPVVRGDQSRQPRSQTRASQDLLAPRIARAAGQGLPVPLNAASSRPAGTPTMDVVTLYPGSYQLPGRCHALVG
jgi:hypothetical protein